MTLYTKFTNMLTKLNPPNESNITNSLKNETKTIATKRSMNNTKTTGLSRFKLLNNDQTILACSVNKLIALNTNLIKLVRT